MCVDPCRGACGIGATCTVENHQPFCLCKDNPYANPLIDCTVRPPSPPPRPVQPVEEGCIVNTQCERDEEGKAREQTHRRLRSRADFVSIGGSGPGLTNNRHRRACPAGAAVTPGDTDLTQRDATLTNRCGRSADWDPGCSGIDSVVFFS